MSGQPTELRGALATGTVLRGYKIESVLGYGGYGVVYRARHAELGHAVALKEYLPADLSVRDAGTVHPRSTECLQAYEDGKRRFLEEARRIVQFKGDPGVVPCLDFFRANGTAYLVMEYVEGMSLADLLREREAARRPLDEEELLSLAKPLLEVLSRLHGAGVLHRDLKPSNILIRRSDGQPVLIDFGAAKQVTAKYSKSAAPFTKGYAALEQVGEGELGPWTDIYATGAVLWRIVAGGNPPWEPPTPSRVEQRAVAVLTGKPDPLPLAAKIGVGRFSAGLLETIDSCLVVPVDRRTQSADDLLTALSGPGKEGPEAVAGQLGDSSSHRDGERAAIAWVLSKLQRFAMGRAGDAVAARGRVIALWVLVAAMAIVGLGWLWKAKYSKPDEWINSIGMTFVRIPAGQFLMGSDSELAYADEQIRTRVLLQSSFWMGKYEVTQGQWQAVMGENPSEFSNCGPDCPVESVSWEEILGFLARLNAKQEGSIYRLPTEAEWEYAARGGVATDTPAGNLYIWGSHYAPLLDAIAWYGGNSGVSYEGGYDCSKWEGKQKPSSLCRPHSVGRKVANAFGLHDMLGNVSEWTMDWYSEYSGGMVTDPIGPVDGIIRIYRGCSWNSTARDCRSSYRAAQHPRLDTRSTGFRLMITDRAERVGRELESATIGGAPRGMDAVASGAFGPAVGEVAGTIVEKAPEKAKTRSEKFREERIKKRMERYQRN